MTAAPVCPECGTPTSADAPAPPRWARFRLLHVLLISAALGWLGWKNFKHAPVLAVVAQSNAAAVDSVDFPARPFTRDNLGKIAAGTITDAGLAGALDIHPDASDTVQLTAAFVPPAGEATDFRRIGWPVQWLVYRWDASYNDVYKRTGAMAKGITRATGWSGGAHMRQRIDADGRRETRLFIPNGFAGAAIFLIVAWIVGRCLAWGIGALVGRRSSSRAAPGAWAIPAACIAGAITVMIVSCRLAPVRADMLLPIPWMPPTAPVGLSLGDVRRLRHEPGGDARLAREVAAAADKLSHRAGEALLIGWSRESVFAVRSGGGGYPRGLVYITEVRQDVPGESGRLSVSFDVDTQSLGLRLHHSPPRELTRQVTVFLGPLCLALLGLWCVWQSASLLLWVVVYRRVRRARRRIGARRCTVCDYELAGLR